MIRCIRIMDVMRLKPVPSILRIKADHADRIGAPTPMVPTFNQRC
jgi:hypothetical protein